jgi:hypothetical protein
LNPRPSGYEPDELPDCSTPRREQGVYQPAAVALAGAQPRERPSATPIWVDSVVEVVEDGFDESLEALGVGDDLGAAGVTAEVEEPSDDDVVDGEVDDAEDVEELEDVEFGEVDELEDEEGDEEALDDGGLAPDACCSCCSTV